MGPLHILLAEKEGKIWLNINMSRTLPIRENNLVVLYVMESTMKFALDSVMLKK